MAGTDRGVMSWLALGLLLDGAASGYDLWHRAERSVAHFWPVTRSALYGELPRLEQRGYVTAEEVAQRNYPDKRVYEVTPEGRRAFVDWLVTADLAERPRHPQQLLLFFAAHAPREHTEQLLAAWRAQVERSRDTCRRILATTSAQGSEPAGEQPEVPRDPRLLTALFGLRRATADLTFLDEIAPVLLAPPDGQRTST
jgi:DNA-binding PadR family transcriptional regulator